MNMKKIGIFIAALVCSFSLFSQGVSINTDGSNADGSAMLDIQSTESGVLIPRMTEAERDAIVSPATGLMIYKTDNTPGFYFNSGTDVSPVWERLIIGDDAVDGSGTATRVAFWDSPSTLSSDADLYWDNTTKSLGIGTNSIALNTSLHINQTAWDHGAVLFSGTNFGGMIDPPSCLGSNMLWYPDKSAFRSGYTGLTSFWSNANIGNYSFSSGYDNIASGEGSSSFGYGTIASGDYSLAVGYEPISSGDFSVSLGHSTISLGDYSIAMGYDCKAKQENSIALGYETECDGVVSVAIGFQDTVTGNHSVAIGTKCKASGFGSYAIGEEALASSDNTYAIGMYSEAIGIESFTFGNSDTTLGSGSMTIGSNLISCSRNEQVFGQHNTVYTPISTTNWEPADRLFVIGNGATSSTRSNALVILKNGNTGIGTSTPSTQFHTTGGVRFANYTNCFLSVDANGNLGVSTSSSLFTDGDGLSWSGTTLNSVWTQSGDDIYNNNTGKVSIGTSTPATNTSLHVEQSASDNGAVVFVGSHSGGAIDPPVCSGATMLWYPDKAAFRTGYVSSSTYWSNANIGDYSFSSGVDNIVSGMGSTAFGFFNNVSGNYSFAAGHSIDSYGDNSVSFGNSSNANGDYSIAMGFLCEALGLSSISLGHQNSCSGDHSTAIGFQNTLTYSNSVAIGSVCTGSANGTIIIGSSSTASGDGAMSLGTWMNAIGDYSMAIGLNGGTASGESSIAFGNNLNAYSAFEQVVGYQNTSYTPNSTTTWDDADRLFVIGNGYVSPSDAMVVLKNGDTGIGTSTPSRKFEVSGVGEQFVRVSSVNHDICGYEWFRSDPGYYDCRVYNNGGNLRFAYSADDLTTVTDLVTFRSSGNVGIGTTAPAYQLQLSTNSAAKPTSSAWTIASDGRLKTDIREYQAGLDSLMMIEPVWFTYTGEAGMPQETGVGVIAQDLQKVAPYMITECTYTDENGSETEYLGVDNGAMTYMLINSVQEQQVIIEELLKQNEDLKRRIEKLEEQ
ncbi:MAG: hypothetical protein C0596_10830 [Marinilabiliales bacterium]|nr:MAG: hypothetical protein C0596_10830 [Marinilabiliales bacterium]